MNQRRDPIPHIIAARPCGRWGDRYARIKPEDIEGLVVLTKLSRPIGDNGQEIDLLIAHPASNVYTHIARGRVKGDDTTIAIDLIDEDEEV